MSGKLMLLLLSTLMLIQSVQFVFGLVPTAYMTFVFLRHATVANNSQPTFLL
jgi:hypothetical protein